MLNCEVAHSLWEATIRPSPLQVSSWGCSWGWSSKAPVVSLSHVLLAMVPASDSQQDSHGERPGRPWWTKQRAQPAPCLGFSLPWLDELRQHEAASPQHCSLPAPCTSTGMAPSHSSSHPVPCTSSGLNGLCNHVQQSKGAGRPQLCRSFSLWVRPTLLRLSGELRFSSAPQRRPGWGEEGEKLWSNRGRSAWLPGLRQQPH